MTARQQLDVRTVATRSRGAAATSDHLDELLHAAVTRGDVHGVAALVADRDGLRYRGAFGARDADQPFACDTIGWLASATKAIVAVAALQLVERGLLDLDAPARDVCPALGSLWLLEGFDGDVPRLRPPVATITLRRLLSHTSGLGYATWNADLLRYHALRRLPSITSGRRAALRSPLVAEPGTAWNYGIGIDWVGLMIEEVTGRRLGDQLRQAVFEPLGMADTRFRLRPGDRSRQARMHRRDHDGMLQPVDLVLEQDPELEGGGAGLYGTADDYMRFLAMLLAGGTSSGVRIIGSDTLDEARRDQIGPLRAAGLVAADRSKSDDVELLPGVATTWSLLGLRNEEPTTSGRSAGSSAWAGLANIYYWVDWANDRAGVLFTQVLPFGDRRVRRLFDDFERIVGGSA